jgi:phosphinothricin acetyltransferase
MSYEFIPLAESNRAGIVAVFNHFVECGFAAYPEERVGAEFFDRLLAMSRGYPAIGIKTGAGQTVGFAFLRAFHPAETFQRTAEITYFILPEHTGQGLGRRILAQFIPAAREMGVDNLVASVSSLNEQSLRFHAAAGFERCGVLTAVGRKFGRDFDVVWFQLRLGS